MRDSHRGEAEGLLVRAVEEEVRRSGGRTDGVVLLGRARAALDTMARNAAEEYEAYTRALDESEVGRLTFGQRYAKEGSGTPLLVAAVAAGTAVVADLSFGVDAGTAVSTGLIVGIASAVATVLKVTASHVPAAHHRAGALGQPGGPEQLRLQWLTALEVRGIRPFLDQQRVLAAATPKKKAPQLRGADKSAAARRRNVLEQSFAQLPEADDRFAGRRTEMGRIRQWVQAARAETETRPTVVVLHGAPGSGRTALAVRATHELRDYFRGACVVDLRADSPEETPLSTRDALMHLLNRLGAPRDQLLFRERTSQDQQVRRLSELYHQHLTALPVTIVLDDASDPEQVRVLVPERSDSLVLVTARTPLALPADLPAWVHQLPVEALDGEGAMELLETAAQSAEVLSSGPPAQAYGSSGSAEAVEVTDPNSYNAEPVARIRELCGGLPLALRIAGSSLGPREPRQLATDLGAYGPVEPVERALWLRYTDFGESSRQLFRRLALAGRASLGAAAAASLLATDETEATRHLTALARAGLIDHVHGNRYRLHDLVRAFAHARLLDEEEPSERTAAQERLIVTYADLADSVLRLVDGNMSTRSDRFGQHGFVSLDEALRWLDDETSFITSTLRHAEGVNQAAVLSLLGALCDYCLLRGDLYRLGELSELAQSVDQGLLTRSVQWRTGIAARQLGELDKARTTLASVVDLYMETNHDAGAARALCSLGITLHHQGNLTEAAAKLLEALQMQSPPQLAADRAWTMHALAAVERDRSHLADSLDLLTRALVIHRQQESLHGEGWAYFQLGQLLLRMGEVPRAESELRTALDLFGRTRDTRGQAWTMTQLARARLVAGDPSAAVDGLRQAASRHRDNEDARGEAWSGYYLGQALEETGNLDQAVRELERSRTMFSRMRDVYGLACARHHSARVTRDQRAVQTGSLRNSGFARQLLVDARADFQRIGVAHGEAWTCLELAVVDAGNTRTPQALALCEEATRLFTSYGDRRGEDWARFLKCTLLPYAAPGGVEIGTAVAQEELAHLSRTAHPLRDEKLTEYIEAYELLLERGVNLESGWRAWTLGMVPNRHAREVMGVPVTGG
ncbi:tetratricopeptide repeat protein [Streptomyces europaeiscabiei]|uniref:Tetratricopeptide repeat protein n=2 Tax=Streptomyces europaeiscabiei TaxID=146819 RepID=A0ABU4NBU5_9ACTN|nr:tetratricopeptide repeat protein [Streptomyces europaeiscabiei]MDX2760456.1 tetratricopeptide repeat protein [Streptomyces europaeiscabiei]MDX2770434.1 tetratricopeptide repeat protein [Streptomyces europaeiscabiei]MDX3543170.1 tetratricopeptide repeat protein [Streptomyces europaeiscabiei]MDX3552986.1 tetratricopeptide repeat protein [Streptomyces europaeiscabiei]MDX3700570.1 tetratricopeptide repeat protein [Streptomyces europaeiscabiei]